VCTRPKYLKHVLLPLIMGAIIYILLRGQGLLVYSWIQDLHKFDPEYILPNNFSMRENIALSWINYNLADGLWVYSLTSFMILVWNCTFSLESIIWICGGLLIAIISELCQVFNLFPGTFDPWDILFYIAGFCIACNNLLLNNSFKKAKG